ncbi:MAG TPA: mannose-1-phosphate guanylyltransferase/mannose-6-phosphate isomerase [Burkholderiaceae bacterium]|nr:mannose-1-phosphate guanylyltransferase/mannose-6-phosphate isomerase [Burkholderiaceae bacterium]
MKIVPIILCGGAGTRLWPVSREAMPKPFIKVGGRSLLRRTWDRAQAIPGVVHTAVVTNVAYSYKVAEELGDAPGASPTTLLLEPTGRNTAPAIALAALWAREQLGDDVALLVLPADHLIDSDAEFASAVAAAAQVAQRNSRIVLFGITPTYADTGYGYVEWGAAIDGTRAHEVARFVEKPSAEKAAEYLKAGNFAWNGGMFCFTPAVLLETMREKAPEVLAAAQAVMARTKASANTVAFDAASFETLPNISIDYAVMEKARNTALVPCKFGWSDIGSWKAVSEVHEADEAGNVTEGNAILVNSRGTYVRSDERVVAAVGVDDLVVIDTADALLVAHKSASQDVKEVVKALRERGNEAYKLHRTVERPWGAYTVLQEGPRFKIKRIEVKPGASLSLQLHHRRSEHWIVVDGLAQVTIGETTTTVKPNESRYVPVGEKHRLANTGTVPLVMIEVQCGDYLGEDDIVRFEDRYGRVQ